MAETETLSRYLVVTAEDGTYSQVISRATGKTVGIWESVAEGDEKHRERAAAAAAVLNGDTE